MSYLYNHLIFLPLYNGLVAILNVFPWMDIGIAVILFTIIVKLCLFHLSKISLITQIRMKEIEPEANRIKQQYANDKQVQAMKIMELYKAKKVKPFAGVLLLFIQLPILLALISVFYKIVPNIHADLLYSFIANPVTPNIHFLGLIDVTRKSVFLAALTAVAQFVQLHFSVSSNPLRNSQEKNKPKSNDMPDFATTLSKQMKFSLPILAFVSTYWIIPASFPQAASIIAIYWTVSALFTLGQEIVIRRQYEKDKLSSEKI